MKNHILFLFVLVVVVGTARVSSADETLAPKFINLQAVLVDDGGNVLKDKQQADISFAVIDSTGVIYEEIQPAVPIIRGAISVLIGSGNDPSSGLATGGLPYDALDTTTGDKLLRLKLSDQSIPQEDLQLVSVPYSYYAQYALELRNPITSEQILDATIKVADLSSEVLDLINGNQPAPVLPGGTAKSISVAPGRLTYAIGNDVQTVLEGFDNTMAIEVIRIENLEKGLADEIKAREDADKKLDGRIDQEIADRKAGDTNLQNALSQEVKDRKDGDVNLQNQMTQEIADRKAGDTNLQNQITQEVVDRKVGDAALQGQITQEVADRQAGDQAEAAARVAGDAAEANTRANADAAESQARQQADATEAQTRQQEDQNLQNQLSNYVLKSGDTMTGTLIMNGANIDVQNAEILMSNNKRVDGVDVSQLAKPFIKSCNQDPNCINNNLVSPDLSLGPPPPANDAFLNPEYTTVKVTGSPSGNPTAGTIYKNNFVFAWAQIKVTDNGKNQVPTAQITGSFNFDKLEWVANSCRWKMTFQTPASSPTSYTVVGNVWNTGGDNGVIVREMASKDYTIVATQDFGDEGNCVKESFTVIVVGY